MCTGDACIPSNTNTTYLWDATLDEFAQFLAASKDKIEEKVHNIEIRQDGPLGLVTFNYDFVVNDKITNSGIEHWQVCKIDGQWKILSVVWTVYR